MFISYILCRICRDIHLTNTNAKKRAAGK